MTPEGMVRRYALTLVELLLVLAILAVLIGMLLPALQLAREASARTECSNNLRLIGEGFQGYHDKHGYFPPGGSQSPSTARAGGTPKKPRPARTAKLRPSANPWMSPARRIWLRNPWSSIMDCFSDSH